MFNSDETSDVPYVKIFLEISTDNDNFHIWFCGIFKYM